MDGRKPESQKFLFFIPWLQLVYYTLALVLPKSTTLSRVRQGVDNSLTSPFLNYVVCYRCWYRWAMVGCLSSQPLWL